jgi:hypothetical protein
LAEAVAMTRELCVADFAQLRLVLADRSQCADVYCTGGVITINAPRDIAEPILFTSSGLGDGVVDPPRRALFEEYFVKGADWRQRQDAYHRHFWPDRRHLSVCMMRPEARTVSLTVVEMGHNQVQMDYFGGAPDQPIEALNARLALRALNGENDQSTRSRTY